MTAALLGPLDYMFGETLNVAITSAVFLAAVFVLIGLFNEWTLERTAKNWLWVTSLVVIFIFTQHSPYRGHGRVLDLSPFNDLKHAQTSEHRRDLVIANAALFAPLGLATAWRSYSFLRAALFACAVSVVAETLQYVAGHGRIAQLEDVIFNVLGAVIGWVVGAALVRTLRTRKWHVEPSPERVPVGHR